MKNSELLLRDQVLFIGGDERLASTRIRTAQIAMYLGCHYSVNSFISPRIIAGKKLFILNKAFNTNRQYLKTLGKVILDVIDPVGIPDDVDGYIVSSHVGEKALAVAKPTFVIHQHHINFSGTPNPLPNFVAGVPLRISFIGEKHWYPKGKLPPHQAYLEMTGNEKEREDYVTKAYLNSDILLNFRNNDFTNEEYRQRHLSLNGGMKLINAMAFGIPSISANEPVFHEVGPDCTIFSTFEKCSADLEELKHDKELYIQLRNNCIKKAGEYSIETIGQKYVEMFKNLLFS